MILSFFAQGSPKGQPRPRAFARKFGDQWQARVYDSNTAEGWKSCVAAAWLQNKPAGFIPYTGPLTVRMTFFVQRPKSHFLKSGLRTSAPSYCISKPDADNYAKAVLDALTQINAWQDDAQVCELVVVKRYADASGRTGAQITVSEISTVTSTS
jgi:Holliday junction resolvase RusA-like endonuclease